MMARAIVSLEAALAGNCVTLLRAEVDCRSRPSERRFRAGLPFMA